MRMVVWVNRCRECAVAAQRSRQECCASRVVLLKKVSADQSIGFPRRDNCVYVHLLCQEHLAVVRRATKPPYYRCVVEMTVNVDTMVKTQGSFTLPCLHTLQGRLRRHRYGRQRRMIVRQKNIISTKFMYHSRYRLSYPHIR